MLLLLVRTIFEEDAESCIASMFLSFEIASLFPQLEVIGNIANPQALYNAGACPPVLVGLLLGNFVAPQHRVCWKYEQITTRFNPNK